MDSDKKAGNEADKLRRRAENYLFMQQSEKKVPQTDSETQRLLHELQVHQVELEVQNTELRRTRDALEKALAMYTELYDFAPVGYFTLTRDGSIQSVNLSGADLLGSEQSRLRGQRFGQFVSTKDRASFAVFLEKIFTGRDKVEGSVGLLNMKNQPLIVRIEAVMSTSQQECLLALIDITKHRQYEERLQYLSTHDTLTGLFNRSFFDAELERLLESRLYPISVIIADVDELKNINDTFGHAAGDQILKLAAKVLRHAVRPEDVVPASGGTNLRSCFRKLQALLKLFYACARAVKQFNLMIRNYRCGSPSAQQRPTTAISSGMPCCSLTYVCTRIKTAPDKKINRLIERVLFVTNNPEHTDTIIPQLAGDCRLTHSQMFSDSTLSTVTFVGQI